MNPRTEGFGSEQGRSGLIPEQGGFPRFRTGPFRGYLPTERFSWIENRATCAQDATKPRGESTFFARKQSLCEIPERRRREVISFACLRESQVPRRVLSHVVSQESQELHVLRGLPEAQDLLFCGGF